MCTGREEGEGDFVSPTIEHRFLNAITFNVITPTRSKVHFIEVTGRIFIPAKVKDSRAWLRQVLYDPKEPKQTFFYTFSTRNSHLSPGKKLSPALHLNSARLAACIREIRPPFFCIATVESLLPGQCLTLPPVRAYLIRNRRYETGYVRKRERERREFNIRISVQIILFISRLSTLLREIEFIRRSRNYLIPI